MKIYKILFSLTLVLCFGFIQAQETGKLDNRGRLALGVWVPDQIEGLPEIAKSNLENKLCQIILENGLGDGTENSRFIISANVSVLSKEVTATAPPMHVFTLDVTLYIGDGMIGKAFSTYNTQLKGAGSNETKAYMNALGNLKVNNPAYQAFIEKGKARIIEYFNTNCDQIIKEAQVLAGMRNYDQAIWVLTSVPDVCTVCWNKAMDAIAPIFKEKINFECKTKIALATNIWNAEQSWDAAQKAGAIMSTIDPGSSCYNETKVLAARIAKRILEVDKREWNFIWAKEITLQSEWIKAIRDIGVAWGKGQPKYIIYRRFW